MRVCLLQVTTRDEPSARTTVKAVVEDGQENRRFFEAVVPDEEMRRFNQQLEALWAAGSFEVSRIRQLFDKEET